MVGSSRDTFIAYLVALISVCCYLALYGGRTGRWSGGVLLAMSLISAALAMTASTYIELQPRMLICDLVSLCLKVGIAIASRRHWPIWVAAFQLNTVLASVAIMLSPVFRNEFYYAMSTIWAVPTLIAMLVGTMLDRRFDKRRLGNEMEQNPHVRPNSAIEPHIGTTPSDRFESENLV